MVFMFNAYGDFLLHLKEYMLIDSWLWPKGSQGPHLSPHYHPQS